MVFSLHSLSVWDGPCPHCSSLYTLSNFSRHVKSVHLHVNLISSFCLYRCPPFLCYTSILSFLFLGASFGLNLTSIWGCLRFIFHAFNCFIRSLEPFKTRLGRLFTYPLIELLEIQWTNQHGSFFSCCHGVCVIWGGRLGKWKVFTHFKRFMAGNWSSIYESFLPHILPIPIVHWIIPQPFFFVNVWLWVEMKSTITLLKLFNPWC